VPNSASVNDSLSSQWKASPCRQRSTNKQRARACAEGAQFGSTIAPKVDQRMRQQPTSSPLPDGRGTADEIDNSSGIGLQFNASFISSCGKNTDRIRPGRSILRSVASRDNRGIDCIPLIVGNADHLNSYTWSNPVRRKCPNLRRLRLPQHGNRPYTSPNNSLRRQAELLSPQSGRFLS